ncbi:MAG: hypothetical protein HY562_03700, partial [Ignavibacteriales bacterium]|nr:hypothetical protein [Ignavibacteriales bacterium]
MHRESEAVLRKRKRIIVLFVFTIVIPSILLGIFAYRSLENESLLMKQSAKEEQAALLRSISEGVESTIGEAERSFEELIRSHRGSPESIATSEWKKLASEQALVKQPFLIRSNGAIVFVGASPLFELAPSPPRTYSKAQFRDSLFQRADRFELVEKDYLAAAEIYQRLLLATRDDYLKAELLIRVARCYKNASELRKASTAYETLSKSFPHQRTISGIPYRVAAVLEQSDLFRSMADDSSATQQLLALFEELIQPKWLMEKEQWLSFVTEIESRLRRILTGKQIQASKAGQHWLQLKNRMKQKMNETERLLLLMRDVIPFTEQARGESGTPGFYRVSRVALGESFLLTSLRLQNTGEAIPWVAAGFEINEKVMRHKLLPDFLSPIRLRGDLACTIQDQQGNVVWGEAALTRKNPSMTRSFASNVPPWTIKLYEQNPEFREMLFESRKSVYLWAIILVAGALVLGTVMTIRLLARELELAKLQGDFVSTVSHEFRSPLTAISQVVEMLERRRLISKDRQQKYYGAIKEETQRLIRMVDNILSVARIEVAQKEYEFKFVDPRGVIVEALEHFQNRTMRNGIQLNTTLPGSLPSIRADRTSLLEALLNLLDNAVKYSTESKRIDLSAS